MMGLVIKPSYPRVNFFWYPLDGRLHKLTKNKAPVSARIGRWFW
jgi:hypothetical protein